MLQSLQDKVVSHTITKEKLNKKGAKTTTTTTYAVTGTQLFALALIYGLVKIDVFQSIAGAAGGAVDAVKSAGEGTAAYFSTIAEYGPGMMNWWRRQNHNSRMKWRKEHDKPDTWMPPGYPAFWS